MPVSFSFARFHQEAISPISRARDLPGIDRGDPLRDEKSGGDQAKP